MTSLPRRTPVEGERNFSANAAGLISEEQLSAIGRGLLDRWERKREQLEHQPETLLKRFVAFAARHDHL
jgi:hypothetical protein